MLSWQTALHFFDIHPWFVPSAGAVVILLTTAYKIVAWTSGVIHAKRCTHADKNVLRYLSEQVETRPTGPDRYGQTFSLYKDCDTFHVAENLRMKPSKVRAILEGLQERHLVRRVGIIDKWSISGYGLTELEGGQKFLKLFRRRD